MGRFKVWQYRRQPISQNDFAILTRDISAALVRNYVCRVASINCEFSGPAERVRLMISRLIGNYPAGEFHHYWPIKTSQDTSFGNPCSYETWKDPLNRESIESSPSHAMFSCDNSTEESLLTPSGEHEHQNGLRLFQRLRDTTRLDVHEG